MSTTDVTAKHPQYVELEPQYTIIQDCLDGELRVKSKRETYLPRLTSDNLSEARALRNYESALTSAHFSDYTRHTLDYLVGLAFRKNPTLDLPPELDFLRDDVNGQGLSAVQLLKEALAQAYAFGAGGFVVRFNYNEDDVVRSDVPTIRPTIHLIPALRLINWIGEPWPHTVVYTEPFELVEGFKVSYIDQYQVVRLDDAGNLTQQLYRRVNDGDTSSPTPVSSAIPIIDAGNRPFGELSVVFFGSQNNDRHRDRPPMYGMASANLVNYRNNAAFQRSVLLTGAATFYLAGLTPQESARLFPKGVPVGGVQGFTLPQGATAGVLQAQPNVSAKEAMVMSKEDMIAMGSTILEQLNVARTATDATISYEASNSPLLSAAHNVGSAMNHALRLCRKFLSTDEGMDDDIAVQLELSAGSTDVPSTLGGLITTWRDAKLITLEEARFNLKKFGVAMEEYDEQIAEENEDGDSLFAANPTQQMPPDEAGAEEDNPVAEEQATDGNPISQ